MEKTKITIDQLKNYLGTGLKLLPDAKSAAYQNVLIGIYQDPCLSCDCVYFGTIDGQDIRTIQEMKPICYRLSDLDKFIPELGFVPLIELAKMDSGLKDVFFGIDDDGHCIGRLNSGVVVIFEITDEVPFVKEIHNNVFGQFSGNEWDDMYMASINPSQIREKLFQWHFWPFGDEYFEQGLVIDKLKTT